MSDQQVEATQNEATEQPQGEPETTDWKAEARKWEARAKENKAAADELESIKAERMTESEKLTARAEKAEKELAALKSEAERTQAAHEVAASTGVPAELLLFCADREAMEKFAEAFKSSEPQVPSAPRAASSRISRGVPEAQLSNQERFAQLANEQLSRL